MTDTVPTPLAKAIAEDLLRVFRANGLVSDDAMANAAVIVQQHINIDHMNLELAAMDERQRRCE